jgi:transposase
VGTLVFVTKSVIKIQRRYRTQYEKGPHSDKAIRRWLKQFKETGSVLHRKGAGRPNILKEDFDRLQEEFSRRAQKSTRQAFCSLVYHRRLFRRLFFI